jgi:predicted amidophosphoribosyltransferase
MDDGSHLLTRHCTIPRSNKRQREDKVIHFNSIHVNPDIAGRKILLLDDVVTTGTTLSAIGQMLMEAGAAKVEAITLAETCCDRS